MYKGELSSNIFYNAVQYDISKLEEAMALSIGSGAFLSSEGLDAISPALFNTAVTDAKNEIRNMPGQNGATMLFFGVLLETKLEQSDINEADQYKYRRLIELRQRQFISRVKDSFVDLIAN